MFNFVPYCHKIVSGCFSFVPLLRSNSTWISFLVFSKRKISHSISSVRIINETQIRQLQHIKFFSSWPRLYQETETFSNRITHRAECGIDVNWWKCIFAYKENLPSHNSEPWGEFWILQREGSPKVVQKIKICLCVSICVPAIYHCVLKACMLKCVIM